MDMFVPYLRVLTYVLLITSSMSILLCLIKLMIGNRKNTIYEIWTR